MKKLSIFLVVLFLTVNCFAFDEGRVCIQKSNGKLIEYQSGNAPLGTLTDNAVSSGYNPNDVEEKYVSGSEWKAIYKKWIKGPADAKKAAKKVKKDAAKRKLKDLGLTDEDLEALF